MSSPFGGDDNDELLLSRYVDGEVSPEERTLIEERLAKDSEFRTKLADVIRLSTTIDVGLAGTDVLVAETSSDDGEREENGDVELVDEEMVESGSIGKNTVLKMVAIVILLILTAFMIVAAFLWWLEKKK